MNNSAKYTKADFLRMLLAGAEAVSADADEAKEYLASEGMGAEAMIQEGLKEIRKMKLKLRAKETEREMLSLEVLKDKARELVEKLMAQRDFSFLEFVAREKPLLQNRNLEALSQEDVKTTLVEYFTLKLKEAQEAGHK